ncbi:phage tail tape measure protein [Streptomyces bacillaris]|uniref:phage tail tape measure protein n=1 Tax=Streptomyces bacillaris TaxID=68179 RepID=UPI003657EA61
MALTVGELVGFIRLDDGEVRPALRRAEGDLNASGRRMSDDAEQTGQRAGQALGDGFTRAADGSIRDSRGRFVSAARRSGNVAGDALGDGLADGARAGADDAVQAAEGGFSKVKMLAAAAGLAAGAVLMEGITQYLEQSQIAARLGAQLGTTPAVAQRYGKIAGELYADAITVDFQAAADAIRHTMSAGLLPPDATNSQIKSIATNVADLASTFELDLGMTASAVGSMIKNGLAKDSKQALDMLAVGLEGAGMAGDDLVETFNEYSPIFKAAGISGATAMGLIKQSIAGGWTKDTDKMADAMKEFSLRAVTDSEGVKDSFKALGLNAKQMGADVGAGGKRGEQALGKVLNSLAKIPASAERALIVQELFGGPGEDLGAALFTLDIDKASKSMDKAGGSADKLGSGLRDNAGVAVEQFKRQISQGVVDLIGTRVIPALVKFGQWAQKNSETLRTVAAVVAGVLVPALVLMGVAATVRAAQVVAGWVMSGVAALRSAGTQVAAAGRVVGGWLLMAGRALVSGASVAAGWVMAGASAAASAAGQVAAGARVVGAWLLMGVQSLIQGARMAAAWVIAMGPVGWVIAAIVGLGILIWKNWDKIVKWTTQAWGWVWDKIKSIGSAIVAFFVKWSLVGVFLRHWDAIRTGVVTKGGQLITWVAGLPGRISRGIGSLHSLLLEKGRNVVQGLWSGIQSMGGWIKSQIMGWARSVIPGPIAKALGIASPSKVTKAQGRWIARGLVDGLTGSAKQVKAAAAKLADIVTDSLKPGKKRSKALGRISSDSKKLVKLADREVVVATRLKNAQQKLADQVKARDQLAADVRKGILDAGNITGDGGPATADSIIQTLQARVGQAQAFAQQLAALRKKGLRADLIEQIASAGVEQGAYAASALANASKSQIKQVNAAQSALVKAAGSAGATAGDALYGSGIRAAQGLVKGLQAEQKAIERQMLTIAKGMQKAIKKALGIKSPSRVMALIGRFIPQGLAEGIDGDRGLVDRSMAGLVDPDAVLTPSGAGSYGGGFASASRSSAVPTVIEIRSDGSRRSDWLIEELRSSVQAKGGDVQLVLGGRR